MVHDSERAYAKGLRTDRKTMFGLQRAPAFGTWGVDGHIVSIQLEGAKCNEADDVLRDLH